MPVISAIPPWLWFSLAGLMLLIFVRLLNQNFRRRVRYDFVRFLRERYPQFEIIAQKESHLLLRRDGHDEQLFLQKLYASIANSHAHEPQERRKIFTHFIDALLEHQDLTQRSLNLNIDGDRIMPRLTLPNFVSGVSRKMKEDLPHTPMSALGLTVVYVLDAPESVMYLTSKHLGELGLSIGAVHERALANLEKKFTSDVVRQSMKSSAINVVKTMDSYDAARLLLVPKYLKDGETLAAAIPDRDTLVLCPVPSDDNWTRLLKLARTADGDALLAKPVKVSATGFEVI